MASAIAACMRATGPRLAIATAAPLARPATELRAALAARGFGADDGVAIDLGPTTSDILARDAAGCGAPAFGAPTFGAAGLAAAAGSRRCTAGQASSAPAAIRKKATRSSMALAWCSSVFAVAAF